MKREYKISHEITRKMGGILSELFPNIFVSVVKTEMNDGVKNANIFLSFLEGDKRLFYRVKDKSKKIRSMLAQRLKLRRVPNIFLVLDNSIEYSQKISSIINEIDQKEGEKK